MHLPDEQEERGRGTPVTYTIIAVSACILIILAVVLVSNGGLKGSDSAGSPKAAATPSPSPSPTPEEAVFEGQEDIEALYREHKLRAEDLDFWGMYQSDVVDEEAEPAPTPTPSPSPSPTVEEMAADGKHVLVTHRDGEEEWVEISEDIPLYTYDFTNIQISGGKMAYYQDGEKCSSLGVDLSKSSGQVDFQALKSAGIDFVMLRLGSRGYESGLITIDESFIANITAAQEAGLEIGVSFFSQAVNEAEAVEEAEFVSGNLMPYRITYPVAFEMEYIPNDEARIDSLDVEKKTEIARAFLSHVYEKGYTPILYGDTDWLLGELDSEKILADYDVWLNDQSSLPDYPYQFKMWKYAVDETVPGVENPASYVISFVDYSRR